MGREEFRFHRGDTSARALLALTAGVAAGLLLLGAGAPMASGAASIESFDAGTTSTQAGGHPDWNLSFTLDSGTGAETAKEATVELPAGFWLEGPGAVFGCTSGAFAAGECESDAQIGLVTVRGAHEGQPDALLGTAPLYILDPGAELVRIGFTIPTVEVPVEGRVSLREAIDYGPRLRLPGLPQSVPLSSLSMTVWGVPGEDSHDGARFPKGSAADPAGCPGLASASCATPTTYGAVVNPQTLNPSVCEKTLSAQLAVTTYEDPGSPVFAEDEVPSTTGCDQQSFSPSFVASATSNLGYTPAGVDVAIAIPFDNAPFAPTASQLQSVIVALPRELDVNPDAPAVSECTDAEAGIRTEAPADCPTDSLLGTAEILGVGPPIPAELHLGESGPSGGFRILILGSGAGAGSGVDLKLEASLQFDPIAERAVLELDLPELPISYLVLHLHEGGPKLFRTPLRCGNYPSSAIFAPWNGDLAAQLTQWPMMISSGPRGAPCLGEASKVQVRLIPQAGPADGAFQSQIAVEVLDPNGTAIPEEDVVVTSSDPGQSIGPVVDNEDGTYSSTVTNSTTPGNVTITATDYSVKPPVSGSAILIQNGSTQPPPVVDPGPGPAATPPVVRISKGAPRRTRSRRPRFSFRADSPGAAFACRLDRGPFRPCSSPFTAAKLSYGPHSFTVRATSAAGTGPSATRSFRVVKPKKKRKHPAG